MSDTDKICTFSGCPRPLNAYGLCQGNRRQQRAGKPLGPIRECKPQPETCVHVGCGNKAEAKSLCHSHYSQLMRDGEVRDLGQRRKPRAARKRPAKAAAKPAKAVAPSAAPEPVKWVPGTKWRELERVENGARQRQRTGTGFTDDSLLFTSTAITDAERDAVLALIQSELDAGELADALGLASMPEEVAA